MKTLTVITTTYNRAYCLHQVYESLVRQTSDDFIWMIVDDGSTDDTRSLVDTWEKENKIEILYYYKDNGGMHTARNYAYERVSTEINVIIDSDDWMTDNAVEIIVACWEKNKSMEYYGMISHNVSVDGKMVGTEFPKGVASETLTNLFGKYGVKGDKKLILRSDLARKYPYPEFPGEKFFPASYKFKYLDLDYRLFVLDAFTCVVDCNENSMTRDKYAQYRSCPRGFAFYRDAIIRIADSPVKIMKEMVHYIAESKYAGEKDIVGKSCRKGYALLCYPAGIGYFWYLQHTKRKY